MLNTNLAINMAIHYKLTSVCSVLLLLLWLPGLLSLISCHPAPKFFGQWNLTPLRGRDDGVLIVSIYLITLVTKVPCLERHLVEIYVAQILYPVNLTVPLHVHRVDLSLNDSAFRQQFHFWHSVRCHPAALAWYIFTCHATIIRGITFAITRP